MKEVLQWGGEGGRGGEMRRGRDKDGCTKLS